jgi:hypothetical protein
MRRGKPLPAYTAAGFCTARTSRTDTWAYLRICHKQQVIIFCSSNMRYTLLNRPATHIATRRYALRKVGQESTVLEPRPNHDGFRVKKFNLNDDAFVQARRTYASAYERLTRLLEEIQAAVIAHGPRRQGPSSLPSGRSLDLRASHIASRAVRLVSAPTPTC